MKNIIIGLGGLGGEIACKLADKNKGNDNKAVFAAIDIDRNDIESIKGKIPAFGLFVNSRMEDYIKAHPEAGIEEWMPLFPAIRQEHLMCSGLSMRCMARVCFNDFMLQSNFEDFKKLLFSPVREGENTIKVTVITSLCGNTGTGIFIQLALWLREFYESFGCTVTIDGAFILPDVFVRFYRDVLRWDHIYSTAYAAIKELNAITKIKLDGVALKHRITLDGFFDSEKNRGDGKAVYDSVFFFDGVNEHGVCCENMTAYKNAVVQSLYTRLLAKSREDILFAEGHFVRQENDAYCGIISSARAVYPKDDILLYCALRMAQDMLKSGVVCFDEAEERVSELIEGNIHNNTNTTDTLFVFASPQDKEYIYGSLKLDTSSYCGENDFQVFLKHCRECVAEAAKDWDLDISEAIRRSVCREDGVEDERFGGALFSISRQLGHMAAPGMCGRERQNEFSLLLYFASSDVHWGVNAQERFPDSSYREKLGMPRNELVCYRQEYHIKLKNIELFNESQCHSGFFYYKNHLRKNATGELISMLHLDKTWHNALPPIGDGAENL